MATVKSFAQVDTIGSGKFTVNVALSVSGVPQPVLYTNVTVVLPPHEAGTPWLLLVNTPLQPPLALAVANQFVKAVSIAPCVWHEDNVRLDGIVSVGVDPTAGTVKVALVV